MASSESARAFVDGNRFLKVLPRSDMRVERGEFIFQQGQPADSLFCIISGRVAITVASDNGKEAMADVLGPGDWFGEQVLLGQVNRTTTAKALLRTELARFKVDSVESFLEREPELAISLVTGMLVRLSRYENALFHSLLDNVEHRLAAVLLHLSQHPSATNGVIQKVSQELLAGMVGTTRSRVNHFMTKFRRIGYIDYRGGAITVRPALRMLVRSGIDQS